MCWESRSVCSSLPGCSATISTNPGNGCQFTAKPVWGYRADPRHPCGHRHRNDPPLLLISSCGRSIPMCSGFRRSGQFGMAWERRSIAILVSAALVQVATGFLNVLNWYGFGWFFPPVHCFLGYVLVGSVLLHVGVKLPDIVYGLRARVSEADIITKPRGTKIPSRTAMPEHCPTRRLPASPGGACSRSLPAQVSESSSSPPSARP